MWLLAQNIFGSELYNLFCNLCGLIEGNGDLLCSEIHAFDVANQSLARTILGNVVMKGINNVYSLFVKGRTN